MASRTTTQAVTWLTQSPVHRPWALRQLPVRAGPQEQGHGDAPRAQSAALHPSSALQ